ncbi:hypothetical protein BZA70DRAFT_279965 [Myxozyma melibiosi]|uniref:BZIP domain-containing protein n=1 Tax=Myxozyma melibiosi TaxID=54550 RepID=A0ABR1F4P0_9ASCO
MSESPEDYGSPSYLTDSSRKRRDELALPLPPGALPPRKRAKTAIEKEQRRIERILRNRQAAQSSREKKRKQLEELEAINEQLRLENSSTLDRLAIVEAENKALRAKLDELSTMSIKRDSSSSSSSTESEMQRIKTEAPSPSHFLSADLSSTSSGSVFDSPTSPSLSSFSPASGSLLDSYCTSPEDSADIPSTPDAKDAVAFKLMHHPAASFEGTPTRPGPLDGKDREHDGFVGYDVTTMLFDVSAAAPIFAAQSSHFDSSVSAGMDADQQLFDWDAVLDSTKDEEPVASASELHDSTSMYDSMIAASHDEDDNSNSSSTSFDFDRDASAKSPMISFTVNNDFSEKNNNSVDSLIEYPTDSPALT